eukprot:CAMPEP_0172603580 /NCGR_PEP_ID=MMETSP1068-20121228/23838_1 /TAXON_ID=35684 /ORGANISM="Pseudopedinella elastica, Strain CCMP716" /LENGTH=279 /DNA_ID=CAMNT_0013405371 /DNA_START=105 /DNA_END=941 /DNA_ORIENTATION=+
MDKPVDDSGVLHLAEHFARKYRAVALAGLLASLLVAGRAAHAELFKHPRISALGTGAPPSMIGGLLGLFVLMTAKNVFGMDEVVENARDHLHEMVTNLIPYAFAALTLGFAAGTSLGGAKGRERPGGGQGSVGDDLLTSWHKMGSILWQEGMPMLLYDQVLGWGNSVVALGLTVAWRALDLAGSRSGVEGLSLSPYAGAVVTLGLETGRAEALPHQLKNDRQLEATVHLADNLGLLLSLGLGCLLLTALRARPLPLPLPPPPPPIHRSAVAREQQPSTG